MLIALTIASIAQVNGSSKGMPMTPHDLLAASRQVRLPA
jgi:hypothetical protein